VALVADAEPVVAEQPGDGSFDHALWSVGLSRTGSTVVRGKAWVATSGPNSLVFGRRTPSCGWNGMSSSDPWSDG
jgi:hypothetical protein